MPAAVALFPQDRVKRPFTATRPSELWVADIADVATWTGFVYVAFVIDVFARRIVGWRVSASMEVLGGDTSASVRALRHSDEPPALG